MIVIDPGHHYALKSFDISTIVRIRFMKRVGPGYPGNEAPAYGGTNIQEVLRVIIDRTKYLNNQIPCWVNVACILLYRLALNLLEYRAAKRHKRKFRFILKIENCNIIGTDGHLKYD